MYVLSVHCLIHSSDCYSDRFLVSLWTQSCKGAISCQELIIAKELINSPILSYFLFYILYRFYPGISFPGEYFVPKCDTPKIDVSKSFFFLTATDTRALLQSPRSNCSKINAANLVDHQRYERALKSSSPGKGHIMVGCNHRTLRGVFAIFQL